VGDFIVAGIAYAKVRRMVTADGKVVKQVDPGTAVELNGWKERPIAGDLVLQALTESDAKRAVSNRTIQREAERDQTNIEALNKQRLAAKQELWKEREKKMVKEDIKKHGQALPGITKEEVDITKPKEFRVIIKADVSGSSEAVREAIKDLGNSEVRVNIVDSSIGEITESDITRAINTEGIIPFGSSNPSDDPRFQHSFIKSYFTLQNKGK
jgi:translation initiation factor IF-2